MTNAIIYQKGSDSITYFVKDCIQTGRDFKGSNISLTGVKEHLFDIKWTDALAEPIFDSEGRQVGFSRKVSDLPEARRYKGFVVSTPGDVDRVTRSLIEAKYPAHEETKIHRQKLAGGGEKDFKTYNDFVDALVKEGKEFKAKLEE